MLREKNEYEYSKSYICEIVFFFNDIFNNSIISLYKNIMVKTWIIYKIF